MCLLSGNLGGPVGKTWVRIPPGKVLIVLTHYRCKGKTRIDYLQGQNGDASLSLFILLQTSRVRNVETTSALFRANTPTTNIFTWLYRKVTSYL